MWTHRVERPSRSRNISCRWRSAWTVMADRLVTRHHWTSAVSPVSAAWCRCCFREEAARTWRSVWPPWHGCVQYTRRDRERCAFRPRAYCFLQAGICRQQTDEVSSQSISFEPSFTLVFIARQYSNAEAPRYWYSNSDHPSVTFRCVSKRLNILSHFSALCSHSTEHLCEIQRCAHNISSSLKNSPVKFLLADAIGIPYVCSPVQTPSRKIMVAAGGYSWTRHTCWKFTVATLWTQLTRVLLAIAKFLVVLFNAFVILDTEYLLNSYNGRRRDLSRDAISNDLEQLQSRFQRHAITRR